MLEALQNLSLTLIVCAVLEALLPPGKGKRTFELLCAVVIFASLLLPLKGTDLSSAWLEADVWDADAASEQLQEESDRALLLAAKLGWKNAAVETLEQSGVSFSAVDVDCRTQDDCVVLQALRVRGVLPQQAAQAEQALRPLCGEEAQIFILTEAS